MPISTRLGRECECEWSAPHLVRLRVVHHLALANHVDIAGGGAHNARVVWQELGAQARYTTTHKLKRHTTHIAEAI